MNMQLIQKWAPQAQGLKESEIVLIVVMNHLEWEMCRVDQPVDWDLQQRNNIKTLKTNIAIYQKTIPNIGKLRALKITNELKTGGLILIFIERWLA